MQQMDRSKADESRRTGALLVEESLLTPEQLEQALLLERETNTRFDEIVVAEFGVPWPDVMRVLARSRDDSSDSLPETGVASAPPPLGARLRRPIGQIFVDLGFITSEEREAALVEQRTTGERIGEILVNQGRLSRMDLASALSEHWESDNEPSGVNDRPSLRGGRPLSLRPLSDEAVGTSEAAVAELSEAVARLESVRTSDGLATGARLAGIEAAVAELAGLDRGELTDGVAKRFDALETRLGHVESISDAVSGIDERLEALGASTIELRFELEALAERPGLDDPGERFIELSLRIDDAALEWRDRIEGLARELRAEAAAAADQISARLLTQADEASALRASVDALDGMETRSRHEAERAIAAVLAKVGQLAARVDELHGLRSTDMQAAQAAGEKFRMTLDDLIAAHAMDTESTHAAQVEAMLAAAERSRVEQSVAEDVVRLASDVERLRHQLETQRRIGEERDPAVLVQELREETAAEADEVGGRLQAQADELSALRASVVALEKAISGARAEIEQTAGASSGELGLLQARIDELRRLRDADAQAATGEHERLRARLDELVTLRTKDTESIQAAHAEAKLAATTGSRVECDVQDAIDQLGSEMKELQRRLEIQANISDEQASATGQAQRTEITSNGKKHTAPDATNCKKGKKRKG